MHAVVAISDHQRHRPAREINADLTGLTVDAACRIDEIDDVPGERTAHRARLDGLPDRVADLCGGLGLPVSVADGQTPRTPNLLDDLGVERLACAHHLAQRRAPGAQ